jgi:kumamolisin
MFVQNHPKTLPWTCIAAALLTVIAGAVQAAGSTIGPVQLPGDRRTIVVTPPVQPQPGPSGVQIITPPSGLAQPGKAHTNVKVGVPPGGYPNAVKPKFGPPFANFLFETPASLACLYRLVPVTAGCNPNVVNTNPAGGSHAIAIVDAYDYPTAASDLNAYIAQFGLAPANFTVIFGTGNPASGCVNGAQPPTAVGTGWDVEEALDIEMAHAMAPSAKLYLVEANSTSFVDLFNAVAVATKCVQANGGGQVSNSWGGDEFGGETAYDASFTAANVVYFASTGDSPGVEYPATSPNVISVGGTSVSRNQGTGAFQGEAVWNSADKNPPEGTGGGPSAVESRPSYQNGISAIVGSSRGTPDLAAIADPLTGVWFFNTPTMGGWGFVGGTSVASPLVAGIVNRSGFFWTSSFAALANIYSLAGQRKLGTYVTDINSGLCGPGGLAGGLGEGFDPQYIETTTGLSWDWCTGWGTLHGSH